VIAANPHLFYHGVLWLNGLRSILFAYALAQIVESDLMVHCGGLEMFILKRRGASSTIHFFPCH
jgi:hypothetical protein